MDLLMIVAATSLYRNLCGWRCHSWGRCRFYVGSSSWHHTRTTSFTISAKAFIAGQQGRIGSLHAGISLFYNNDDVDDNNDIDDDNDYDGEYNDDDGDNDKHDHDSDERQRR